MKKNNALLEGISIIDEILENKGRKNVFGTCITGIGLTIAAVGISVLMNKTEDTLPEIEQKSKDEIE